MTGRFRSGAISSLLSFRHLLHMGPAGPARLAVHHHGARAAHADTASEAISQRRVFVLLDIRDHIQDRLAFLLRCLETAQRPRHPAHRATRIRPSFFLAPFFLACESLPPYCPAFKYRTAKLQHHVRRVDDQVSIGGGSQTVKLLPSPALLAIESSPRQRFKMCFTMARPRPVPPMLRDRATSTR